jgi:Zn-finger nucleic acid-binding protein
MPLLVSPIDGTTPMQQIVRNGIEIDRCPVSGGVWFDRGELEKLLLAIQEAHHEERTEYVQFAKEQQSHKPSYQDQSKYQQPQKSYIKPDHEYDDYYRKKHSKKSKMKDFLDIFDF